MTTGEPWDDVWIGELSRTYSVEPALLRRLGDEFLALFDQTLEEYVAAEHRRWQRQGLRNDQIWEHLARTIPSRRFRVSVPSARQLRRIIYG